MNLGFVERFGPVAYLLGMVGFLTIGIRESAFREPTKNRFNKHPVSKIIFENMENASLQKMINSILLLVVVFNSATQGNVESI